MNQDNAPLYEALIAWKNSRSASFHVPGHKNGALFPDKARSLYKNILTIDSTELNGLDDLHDPQTVIKEAQQLTAHFYGARESYFLVGGSTVGNLAMIMATCAAGDTVLVQRNCHQSIMNGLELANVRPVFLTPFFSSEANVAVGVTLDTVKAAHADYPDASVLLLTTPNYYGMTMNDLEAIIQYAHEHDMIVLVDEAHGSHFVLGPPFPTSALTLGADVVVHSAHKTLPAMTMGSFLHVNERYPKRDQLKKYLAIMQSTSPSYPIMASLDLARWYMAQLSRADVLDIVRNCQRFRSALAEIRGIRTVDGGNEYEQDPLKIILQSELGLSGVEMQKKLEARGIYSELADHINVLLVMPIGLVSELTASLAVFRKVLSDQTPPHRGPMNRQICDYLPSPYSSLALSYREMENRSTKTVALAEAAGEISAESLIPYPPGIPLIVSGEEITDMHVAAIENLLNNGVHFQGNKLLKKRKIDIFVSEKEGEERCESKDY